MILVTAEAGGKVGVGCSYAGPAAATLITSTLAELVEGSDALTPTATSTTWRDYVSPWT